MSAASNYKIIYHRATGVAADLWPGPFSSARAHAKEAVDKGNAERAEVRDEAGQMVFEYPKTLRRIEVR